MSPCLGDGRRGIGATETVARRLAANCNVAAGGCGTVLPGQACAQLDAACQRGTVTAPQVRTRRNFTGPQVPQPATATESHAGILGRARRKWSLPAAASAGLVGQWHNRRGRARRGFAPSRARSRCQAQSCAHCQAEPAGHLMMLVLAL